MRSQFRVSCIPRGAIILRMLPDDSKALVVLGMRHSGAEFLTRLLERMGPFGGKARSGADSADNPSRKTWEMSELGVCCSNLLAEASIDGCSIADLDLDRLSPLAREQGLRRMRNIFQGLDRHRPSVLSEPRLTLLLPLLRPLLDQHVFVVVWRHPLEVAHLLHARDGVPLVAGLAMWEYDTARALDETRALPRALVSHLELVQAPIVTLERLRQELTELGVRGLRALEEAEARAEIDPDGQDRLDAAERDEARLFSTQARLLRQLEDRSVGTPNARALVSASALQQLRDYEGLQRKLAETNALLEDSRRETAALRERAAELEALQEHDTSQVAEHRSELHAQAEVSLATSTQVLAARSAAAAVEKQRGRIGALEQKLARVQEELHAILWSRRYRIGSALAETFHRVFPRSFWSLGERFLNGLRPLYRKLGRKRYEPTLPASMSGLVLTHHENGRIGGQTAPHDTWIHPILPHPGFGASVVTPVTIVLPVFNAIAAALRCVESLRRNLTYPAEVLLIDDASTDKSVGVLCAELQKQPGWRVLRNATNQGYTRTINHGIAACNGDVVLLNSDAEVGPRWLENMVLAAYSRERVATVTGISDNAGAFSVPDLERKNEIPKSLSFDDAARLVMQDSSFNLPVTPTGSGFCMYVRRTALEEVGPFDAERFPRGFGEENEFCMRAAARGWMNLVDDRTYVRHARTKSFAKAERDSLLVAGRKIVEDLHPDYMMRVRLFLESEAMNAVRERVRDAFARAARLERRPRPRVLFVIHEGSGGTAETNRDLMQALEQDFEALLLSSNGRALSLSLIDGGAIVPLDVVRLQTSISVATLTSEEYRAAIRRILVEHSIELVHVRHLFGHTLDLPEVACGSNIPVIVSLHDYYYVCPTINLLDERDQYCGGRCTAGDGTCRVPTRWTEDLPVLKHRYVYTWREEVGARVFAHVDACVTTTQSAKDVVMQAFPSLSDKPFEVIEHGRDLEQHDLAARPDSRGPLRVLILGNLTAIKGGGFVRAVHDHDREGRIEFHVLGQCHREYADLAIQHGPYERTDMFKRIGEIAPNVVGLFSIWAETYSHTLTEAWAAGIPVIATDLGAFRERILAHGGGWLVDPSDPKRACELLLSLGRDSEAWQVEAVRARLGRVRRVADMAADYRALYRSVLDARRLLARPAATVVGSSGAVA